MFEPADLLLVAVVLVFLAGIVAHLTAPYRHMSRMMKTVTVEHVVFRGDGRVGILRCALRGNDRRRLRAALAEAPSSFVNAMPSANPRGIMAAAAQELPIADREATLRARLSASGAELRECVVLFETSDDDRTQRLNEWIATPCKYRGRTLEHSCTMLELWLDAQTGRSAWSHKPAGEWEYTSAAVLSKENRPLWVYRRGSASGVRSGHTFESVATGAASAPE